MAVTPGRYSLPSRIANGSTPLQSWVYSAVSNAGYSCLSLDFRNAFDSLPQGFSPVFHCRASGQWLDWGQSGTPGSSFLAPPGRDLNVLHPNRTLGRMAGRPLSAPRLEGGWPSPKRRAVLKTLYSAPHAPLLTFPQAHPPPARAQSPVKAAPPPPDSHPETSAGL